MQCYCVHKIYEIMKINIIIKKSEQVLKIKNRIFTLSKKTQLELGKLKKNLKAHVKLGKLNLVWKP